MMSLCWRRLLCALVAGWLLAGCGQRHPVEPGQTGVEILLEPTFSEALFLAEETGPATGSTAKGKASGGGSLQITIDDPRAVLALPVAILLMVMMQGLVHLGQECHRKASTVTHAWITVTDGPPTSLRQRLGWGENRIAVPSACFDDDDCVDLNLELHRRQRVLNVPIWIHRSAPRLELR